MKLLNLCWMTALMFPGSVVAFDNTPFESTVDYKEFARQFQNRCEFSKVEFQSYDFSGFGDMDRLHHFLFNGTFLHPQSTRNLRSVSVHLKLSKPGRETVFLTIPVDLNGADSDRLVDLVRTWNWPRCQLTDKSGKNIDIMKLRDYKSDNIIDDQGLGDPCVKLDKYAHVPDVQFGFIKAPRNLNTSGSQANNPGAVSKTGQNQLGSADSEEPNSQKGN